MIKNKNEIQNNSLMILNALLIFDVWLLIKARQLLRLVNAILILIFKCIFFMLIGAAVLSYFLMNTKFDIRGENRELSCQNNEVINKYLELNGNSTTNAISLQKEYIEIKNMKMNVQKSLYKMNFHLQHLYDQQKMSTLADFASEAVGGIVIDTPGTESYYKPSTQWFWFGIPIWKPTYFTPRKIIQPWHQPGECWAFSGSQGKIEIQLAHAAIINKVTLEHITASASLTGDIDSAPKAFNVLGKTNDQYVMIDTFLYKNNGQSSQTFTISKSELKSIPFKRIILEILSNWGNPNYTCIYRFKVHGKIHKISHDDVNMNVQ